MNQYLPIWQSNCGQCDTTPVVGILTPSRQIINTNLCGGHFFGDRLMTDPELWNNHREATE